MPTAQGTHSAAPAPLAYKPAEQGVQAAAPARAKLPGAHVTAQLFVAEPAAEPSGGTVPAGHRVHAAEPAWTAKLPTAHGVHTALPVSE